MISLLRFRDVEYFLAVAEQGSFSRAAEVCGIGQPTLSGQIRRMEELFGGPLFERGAGPVVPSAKGAELLPAAKLVWEGYERMRRSAAGDGVFLGRPLRFGVLPTIAPYFAPDFLTALMAMNEGAEVAFVEGQTDPLEAGVLADTLDFAVTATTPDTEEIAAVPLMVERLSAVSRAPLGAEVRIEGMHGPLLLMQEGHCFRAVVQDAIRRAGAGAPGTAKVGPASFATLLSLVRAGMGETVVPTPFVDAQPGSFDGLHVSSVTPRHEGRELRLLVRTGRERYGDVMRLVETAQRVLRRPSGPASAVSVTA